MAVTDEQKLFSLDDRDFRNREALLITMDKRNGNKKKKNGYDKKLTFIPFGKLFNSVTCKLSVFIKLPWLFRSVFELLHKHSQLEIALVGGVVAPLLFKMK